MNEVLEAIIAINCNFLIQSLVFIAADSGNFHAYHS